jgi:hypothetical protein
MIEMLEKPAKEQETKVDPRLEEVVRIIVEQFGGDVRAYIQSIRPKTEPNPKAERLERQLLEAAARSL